MQKISLLLASTVASLFCWSTTCLASSASDFTEMSLRELMDIQIFNSASLLPTPTNKAPNTVYSFHRADFKRYGARSVEDLLETIPGIQLNQYRKRHQSIWARGLIDRYNDKLVLLIDGVRIQHLYYGDFSLGDSVPLEKVDTIEVILGPASSLYGANAFGGIIAITTRQFSDGEPQADTSVELGDNQRRKITGQYQNNYISVFASALEQKAPFDPDRKSFIGGRVLQSLDETAKNLMLKVRPIDNLILSVDYTETEFPFLFIPETQDALIDTDHLSATLQYQLGNIDSGKLELQLWHQIDNTEEYELEHQTKALAYRESQDARLSGFTATVFKRFENHTLTTGMQWKHESIEDSSFERYFRFDQGFLPTPTSGNLLRQPNYNMTSNSIFVQDVWAVNNKLDLTLGGRYDKLDVCDDETTFRGAAVYSPTSQQNIKLLYGTAIRTPSMRENAKWLENTPFIAPPVRPESIDSLELSYRYQWNDASININAYQNTFENLILEQPTPDDADEFFANRQTPIKLRGIETQINLRPLAKTKVQLGISHIHSDQKQVGELPYLAKWSAHVNSTYNYRRNQKLGLSLLYNSHRRDTNSFDGDQADAFVKLNLFGSGQLSQHLFYEFGIDNVLDAHINDPSADFGNKYNTQRSEREIWIGISWSLDS